MLAARYNACAGCAVNSIREAVGFVVTMLQKWCCRLTERFLAMRSFSLYNTVLVSQRACRFQRALSVGEFS